MQLWHSPVNMQLILFATETITKRNKKLKGLHIH